MLVMREDEGIVPVEILAQGGKKSKSIEFPSFSNFSNAFLIVTLETLYRLTNSISEGSMFLNSPPSILERISLLI